MVVVTELPDDYEEENAPEIMPQMEKEVVAMKEEGNTAFKNGQYEQAIDFYSKALKQTTARDDRAVLLKNRAACYLKMGRNTDAATDCTDVLDICPNDTKALFRRCQAFEGMEKVEEAYKDAMALVKADPRNKAIQPVLERLMPIIHEKVDKSQQTGSKVKQMFELSKDGSADIEKKRQAATNLIVLAREEAGAEKIWSSVGGPEHLIQMLDEKDEELRITAVRVLACLANNSRSRATNILERVTLEKILLIMGHSEETLSTASANLIQSILNAITNLEVIKKERDQFEHKRLSEIGCKLRPYPWVYEKIDKDVVPLVDKIMSAMLPLLTHRKVSAFGRDNVLELLVKFVTRKDGAGWSIKMVENKGIGPLLDVAGALEENSLMPVSKNSRSNASLVLSKIWNDFIQDGERDKFREAVDEYFNDLFSDGIMESKVEAVMALAALLQGPFEVGNAILGKPGVLEIILALADSENAMHVKYAVEALVHSASKKDRCTGVIKQATPILKELYQSKNEHVKVRALVGLCKLGSFGGSDASAKSFADGSTQTLAKACRKFLKNAAKDADLRKWAAEGLAYLCLDADVKQDFVDDTEALRSLIELAKVGDTAILYPVAQVFVNCTNAYDENKPDPELIELAKFAKHHVPEAHAKDQEPFISERVTKMVKNGLVNALVAFSKAESENSRELLARTYLAIADNQEHRGLLVQQGGAKALLPLALEGTKDGKTKAAQALAKIGITMNPEVAFPGQRMCEVVRPMVLLLGIEREALENFEALMALTNLASINTTIRKRMLKEHVFGKVDYYIYEEHPMLKRAALECMCNLMMEKETLRYFQGNNDRVKYFMLTAADCMDDDADMSIIAATTGGLAMISYDPEVAKKIVSETNQWYDILQSLAIHPAVQIQHRGMHILMNIMTADKDICQQIVESPLFEVLLAFSKFDDPERASVKTTANRCLEIATEWELIQPIKDGATNQFTKDNLVRLMDSIQSGIKRRRDAREKEEDDKYEEEQAKLREKMEKTRFAQDNKKEEATITEMPALEEEGMEEIIMEPLEGAKIEELSISELEEEKAKDSKSAESKPTPAQLESALKDASSAGLESCAVPSIDDIDTSLPNGISELHE